MPVEDCGREVQPILQLIVIIELVATTDVTRSRSLRRGVDMMPKRDGGKEKRGYGGGRPDWVSEMRYHAKTLGGAVKGEENGTMRGRMAGVAEISTYWIA